MPGSALTYCTISCRYRLIEAQPSLAETSCGAGGARRLPDCLSDGHCLLFRRTDEHVAAHQSRGCCGRCRRVTRRRAERRTRHLIGPRIRT